MFNIDTIELISEYNVYQELLMAYEKQLLMEEYIFEDGEEVAKNGIGSSIKAGGKKIATGLLNLLKKGYNLFVRFLNKLKQMFANMKKKLIEKPWYESRGYYIRIVDKRVLELIKSKYKSLIFDENGQFIQTSDARDLMTTKQYIDKIRGIFKSDTFSSSFKFFSEYIKKLDNERTIISDDKLDEVSRYTKIDKVIGDDLKKILDNVRNSKPVKLEDITNKNYTASIFYSTDFYISLIIDEYNNYNRTFKDVIEFFEDKYKLHDKDKLALKINYNKALKLIVDHVNVITNNLKNCVELSNEYNLIEYHKFINFLYEANDKQFKTDYHQYKSEKRAEQRKADKEKFDEKMDNFKSKFKKNKKSKSDDEDEEE